jgi:hypothetical protein
MQYRFTKVPNFKAKIPNNQTLWRATILHLVWLDQIPTNENKPLLESMTPDLDWVHNVSQTCNYEHEFVTGYNMTYIRQLPNMLFKDLFKMHCMVTSTIRNDLILTYFSFCLLRFLHLFHLSDRCNTGLFSQYLPVVMGRLSPTIESRSL